MAAGEFAARIRAQRKECIAERCSMGAASQLTTGSRTVRSELGNLNFGATMTPATIPYWMGLRRTDGTPLVSDLRSRAERRTFWVHVPSLSS